MKESERLALIAKVVQKLNEAESWTGRMRIQKYVYLAQALLGLSSDYPFVLYQRGPYSFELDTDIRSFRAIRGIDLEPMPAPYGPRYFTTSLGNAISKLYPANAKLDQALTDLAKALRHKDAPDLELLATAHYVLMEGKRTDEERIQRLRRLKPHFSIDQARTALEEATQLQKQFISQ